MLRASTITELLCECFVIALHCRTAVFTSDIILVQRCVVAATSGNFKALLIPGHECNHAPCSWPRHSVCARCPTAPRQTTHTGLCVHITIQHIRLGAADKRISTNCNKHWTVSTSTQQSKLLTGSTLGLQVLQLCSYPTYFPLLISHVAEHLTDWPACSLSVNTRGQSALCCRCRLFAAGVLLPRCVAFVYNLTIQ